MYNSDAQTKKVNMKEENYQPILHTHLSAKILNKTLAYSHYVIIYNSENKLNEL